MSQQGKAGAVLADSVNRVTASAMGGMAPLAMFKVAVLMPRFERYRGTAWRRSGGDMKLISNTGGLTCGVLTLHSHGPGPSFWRSHFTHICLTIYLLLTFSLPLYSCCLSSHIGSSCCSQLWEHCLSDLSPWCQGDWVDGHKSGEAKCGQWEWSCPKHFLLKQCLFRLWDASRR